MSFLPDPGDGRLREERASKYTRHCLSSRCFWCPVPGTPGPVAPSGPDNWPCRLPGGFCGHRATCPRLCRGDRECPPVGGPPALLSTESLMQPEGGGPSSLGPFPPPWFPSPASLHPPAGAGWLGHGHRDAASLPKSSRSLTPLHIHGVHDPICGLHMCRHLLRGCRGCLIHPLGSHF